MNVFVLDRDMEKSVRYTCDKHVSKMCVEHVQILSTAYYHTGEDEFAPYQMSHQNGPHAVWVRTSLDNWMWLYRYTELLGIEYAYRYGKQHLSIDKVLGVYPPSLPSIGMTSLPEAMPVMYKNKDVIKAYRAYYNGEKQHIRNYTKREIPDWFMTPYDVLSRIIMHNGSEFVVRLKSGEVLSSKGRTVVFDADDLYAEENNIFLPISRMTLHTHLKGVFGFARN